MSKSVKTDGLARPDRWAHPCLGTHHTTRANVKAPGSTTRSRARHVYGHGPFAKLRCLRFPINLACTSGTKTVPSSTSAKPRSHLRVDSVRMAIQRSRTTTPLPLRQQGRRNGGQQTNCRINALANLSLDQGHVLTIWYRIDLCAIRHELRRCAGWALDKVQHGSYVTGSEPSVGLPSHLLSITHCPLPLCPNPPNEPQVASATRSRWTAACRHHRPRRVAFHRSSPVSS